MSVLTNIIIVGATGNLGPSILKAIRANPDYNVSILSREGSPTVYNPPRGIQVLAADYSSKESLVEALSGQDAIISVVGAQWVPDQTRLIDAAIEAGVKRFIPSEFGSDTLNENTSKLAFFKPKIAVINYLKEKAAEGKITWTALGTGPFLDWGLKVGFIGFDIANKKATIYDGGSSSFSATTLADIGRAIDGILTYPKETENKFIFVHSAVITQKQILAYYEKLTGVKWEIEDKDTAEIVKSVNAELAQGEYSRIHHLIFRIFSDGHGSHFKSTSNELFEIPVLDEAGVEEIVKSTL